MCCVLEVCGQWTCKFINVILDDSMTDGNLSCKLIAVRSKQTNNQNQQLSNIISKYHSMLDKNEKSQNKHKNYVYGAH